ncbi:hypothetical protein [Micromonospora inyonensis]|uniref:Helix-hairpin-helix domain-containing protein n=1 Tax=Micromonospora inyonensis TaxID=47866 RepID=A0A1C6SEF3_9ACTN|nr:hypothetical protein GA0074694_4888 [Micromonospora inyonensis]
MAWTFGHSLLLILAVAGGVAAGWALRGRRAPGRPASRVDPVRPATVTRTAPTPDTADRRTDPAVESETVDVPATPGRSDDTPDRYLATEPVPAGPTPPPAAHAEPVDAQLEPVDAQAEPVTVPVEPPAPPAGLQVEPVDAQLEPVEEQTEPVTPQPEPAEPELTPVPRSTTQQTQPLPAPVAEAAQARATSIEPDAAENAPVEVEPTTVEPAEIPPVEVEPTTVEPAEIEPTTVEPTGGTGPAVAEENVTAVPAPRDADDVPADDDFRRIQGIGPKIAAALQAAGIRTYRQLAERDEAGLREVIRGAGLRSAPGLASWPQQARILADAPAEADKVFPAPTA